MHFEVLANPTLEMPDLIALIKLANTVKVCPFPVEMTLCRLRSVSTLLLLPPSISSRSNWEPTCPFTAGLLTS